MVMSCGKSLFLAACAGPMVLLGCGPPAPPGKTVVDYWTGWGAHELELQRELVAEFNAAHPKIHVNLFCVAGAYQKVRLAFAAEDPPDVCSAMWMSELASYAERGVLSPLDEKVAEKGWGSEDLLPGLYDGLSYEGQLYALATTINTYFLVYNQRIFAEVGRDPNWYPRTLDELEEVSRQCTVVAQDGRLARYGYRPASLTHWAIAFGGSWYDPATRTVTADHPKNVDALRWLVGYVRDYGVERLESFEQSFGNWQSADGSFFSGRVAMYLTGEWFGRFAERYGPNMEWGYFPLPTPPGGLENVLLWDGSVFVIPAAARHPEEAWEFLSWICAPEQSARFCLGIGNLSPWREVLQREDFRRDPLFAFAADLALGANAQGPPPMPVWAFYRTEIGRAEDFAIHGRGDPKELLEKVTVKVQRELDRYYADREAA